MKIQKKIDGTYIIDFKGMPFHVTPDYPSAEQYGKEITYAAINIYAKEHPEEVIDYIEPIFDTPEISEEQSMGFRIEELEAETQKLLPAIQAGIDADINQQKLINIMLEIENLKGNI